MSAAYGKPLSDLASAEQDQKVVALKRQDLSFAQIAEQLGISKSQAHRAFQRALNRIPAEDVQAYRAKQLEDIALAREIVYDTLAGHHYLVQNGRIVCPIIGGNKQDGYEFGDPLEDPGPVLAAVDRLVKLGEREAAILGSDAEKKVNLSGGLRYEIVGVDPEALT